MKRPAKSWPFLFSAFRLVGYTIACNTSWISAFHPFKPKPTLTLLSYGVTNHYEDIMGIRILKDILTGASVY